MRYRDERIGIKAWAAWELVSAREVLEVQDYIFFFAAWRDE